MKAIAKVYRGIEFICVGELPADQQLLLKHSQEPERIKILVDGKILGDCVQYNHYSQWFEKIYASSVPSTQIVQEKAIPVKIALVKA